MGCLVNEWKLKYRFPIQRSSTWLTNLAWHIQSVSMGRGGQYLSVFCDGCVLGVFVVCTIVQAGSSVCTHRQVGPERRRGREGVSAGRCWVRPVHWFCHIRTNYTTTRPWYQGYFWPLVSWTPWTNLWLELLRLWQWQKIDWCHTEASIKQVVVVRRPRSSSCSSLVVCLGGCHLPLFSRFCKFANYPLALQ